MFLAAVAERRRPVEPAPAPQAPVAQPPARASFPPDGMTPATPDQIRSFFSK